MKIYSKIIGSTLSMFFIFLIILAEKSSYQGRKKNGKNKKKLLNFHEKNDKNGAKKFQFFSILNQF